MNTENLKVGFREVVVTPLPVSTINIAQTVTQAITPNQLIAQSSEKFRFDSTTYPSCSEKTGKYLNMKGEVVKKPKNTSKLIYANSSDTILGTEGSILYCVKSAKKYGFVKCSNKTDQILDFKGKKAQTYLRGTVFYANAEFGDIYTDKSNGLNCTNSDVLLTASKW